MLFCISRPKHLIFSLEFPAKTNIDFALVLLLSLKVRFQSYPCNLSTGCKVKKLLSQRQVVSFGLFFFFFQFIYLFIYFWLGWVSVAACGLSLVAANGGYSSLQCVGFLLRWFLFLRSTGSRRTGFSSCGTWAQ